ncbi:MAG TPA: phage holin family protein [Gemmataceae bacterium]|nr:phage holin family protein [Gemmataceae bacterium]
MRNDTLNGSEQASTTTLVSGILSDVQQLLAQQTRLLRLEIREDLQRARTGAIVLGSGLGITAIGGLLLCVMLPLLLSALTGWPEWVSFGIFGVLFLFIGGGATFAAMKKFQDAASLPESTTTLKENMACLLRRT